mmetsp:Transcript_44067/g.58477  ORF Transcript_44067/g.58477 Transcript_44067/m.58477 type:complete len:87 (-) Transcript_44067:171-431(-)|eukprot:CAMPEP_0185573388 /NCGR_PEP_ID=MMETSP0434-20130131/5113_1 /TAXON_ID=626734 ORGANISM="Favella taraikaensis, Strain Fe Narragansett Bay" /NCGR_SAMPLE_ID=MMETSP0434 /ASSEMBLY_ACC=CAM_ASM_000379 /LENGTH=86 /DNA_ID=CAMNT_0028189599 /DNA_START=1111 /DNA_END=1371 /DNA_ORIENTATION=+
MVSLDVNEDINMINDLEFALDLEEIVLRMVQAIQDGNTLDAAMIENEARAMYYKHQMKVQIHSLGGIDDLTMAEKMELEKMIENEF